MRKILICLVLIIALFLCYSVVSNGFTIGDIRIANYSQVGAASKQIDTLIGQLVNLNSSGLDAKKKEIQSAISDYGSQKEQYESMKEAMNTSIQEAEQEMTMVDMYDIDFLWTIIGNYATEEGVNLKMDLMKSILFADLDVTEYTMCDMKFTLTGDYIAITELIYDIEDDDRLGFEISNFEMVKGGENLMATFTVKGVPVNNRTLSTIQTSIDSSSETNTDGNTTGSNSVSEATSNALEKTGQSLSSGKVRDSSNTTTANALDM